MKNATELWEKFQQNNVKDYTYLILFFVVSSFFAFLVIKPVLTIAISIQREAEDLERINKTYENNIMRVLELQSDVEALRTKKALLGEALPSQPKIENVIYDIKKATGETGVNLNSFSIGEVTHKKSLKTENEKLVVNATIEVDSNYDNVDALVRSLLNQRRIKNVEILSLSSSPTRMGGFTVINLSLELETFYTDTKIKDT